MSDKPVIFISHSSKDDNLAKAMKEQIILVLGINDANDVFVSSTPNGINCGEIWFSRVLSELQRATAFIVLLTQNSILSNWVWFEIGHFWDKNKIYPLYVAGIEIPHPLSEKQAKLINNPDQLQNFFETLCKEVGGDVTRLDAGAILESASRLETGLTDDETKRKMLLFLRSCLEPDKYGDDGQLVLFTDLDTGASIPPGSSRNFIEEVKEAHFPDLLMEPSKNGVIFKQPPHEIEVIFA